VCHREFVGGGGDDDNDYYYYYYYCPRCSDTVLFSSEFFSLYSRTAALSSMEFCINMFLDNRTNSVDFQGHRSKVKVTGPYFRILYHCEIGQKVR